MSLPFVLATKHSRPTGPNHTSPLNVTPSTALFFCPSRCLFIVSALCRVPHGGGGEHLEKPLTVASRREKCLRVLTGNRRRDLSFPLASLSFYPPSLVLKIFCQAHSFDNNPAESRSSPKVQSAPGAPPPPPHPPYLPTTSKLDGQKGPFFGF